MIRSCAVLLVVMCNFGLNAANQNLEQVVTLLLAAIVGGVDVISERKVVQWQK